jgi:hypothetical protein
MEHHGFKYENRHKWRLNQTTLMKKLHEIHSSGNHVPAADNAIWRVIYDCDQAGRLLQDFHKSSRLEEQFYADPEGLIEASDLKDRYEDWLANTENDAGCHVWYHLVPRLFPNFADFLEAVSCYSEMTPEEVAQFERYNLPVKRSVLKGGRRFPARYFPRETAARGMEKLRYICSQPPRRNSLQPYQRCKTLDYECQFRSELDDGQCERYVV